jgi:lipopolysaccharide export system permease protein
MNTLDRYIARQYLFNVLALLVILFSFVIVVDVALNVDQLFDAVDRMNQGNATGVRRLVLAVLGVFDLWWPRLLQLFGFIIGLVLVAGMGFTFTQLVRNREMVGMLAGGISLYRISRPVLIVAALVMALKVINQELVLSRPQVAPLLSRSYKDIGERDWSSFQVSLVKDASDRLFLARTFDPPTQTLTDVTIWFRSQGLATHTLTAPKAVWRDGGWDLTDPSLRSLKLGATGQPAPVARNGQTSIALPAGLASINRVETDMDPNTLKFRRFRVFSQSLSWGQIGEMLERPNIEPELRTDLQRIRWSRVSQLLSAMLSLIITMPFFLVREPRNMLGQSLKCAPIGIGSLMGGILLSTVNWPGFPPGLGVFIPVLILVPLAIAVVSYVRS